MPSASAMKRSVSAWSPRRSSSGCLVLALAGLCEPQVQQARAYARAIAQAALEDERALERRGGLLELIAVQRDDSQVVIDPRELLEISHLERREPRPRA
jgi:hypothetical protein